MAGTLKRYNATVNGHATVLKLTEVDARKHGLSAADEVGAKKPEPKKAAKPANKAVTPKNKGAGNVDTAGHSR